MSAEQDRLRDTEAGWKRWGPYLSEREWGTVREDYSADGSAWAYLPHDHARSRAYRWNEDGLAGVCDDRQRLCLALCLWNDRDSILKERLFGLSGPEGNHGEDVKEVYFYLSNTPTHSSMRMVYKYPQGSFPYAELVEANRKRRREEPEFELIDTAAFAEDRYFDVYVEYAKGDPEDILLRIEIVNRGPEAAPITVLPTLWYRNTWSWREAQRPALHRHETSGPPSIRAEHPDLGSYVLAAEQADELIFTDNDTNFARLFGVANPSPYVKDAFHRYVIDGEISAVNPAGTGTKAAAVYRLHIPAGATEVVRLRLRRETPDLPDPFVAFENIIALRRAEAEQFYQSIAPRVVDVELRQIMTQALSGMLWSKQYYHFNVDHWLHGDQEQPPPPAERQYIRNSAWLHLANADVLSMPDKWEYPWYASWDLALQCVALAMVDIEFAKTQIDLLTREWFQHPNGQLPAYEWSFDDVNPPVAAWAALRLYHMGREQTGNGDRSFLERVFHKLLLNFTWWVNRKDSEGNNIFEGGFLGLDNIGVFDRSAPLPTGGHIEQSDGTSWMGMYCLNMLSICIELAGENAVYEDIASKFFDHFLFIAGAMANIGGRGLQLWNDDDEFFYDMLHLPDGRLVPLKVRSFVGLIPLFAVLTIDPQTLSRMPRFAARLDWFLSLRPELAELVSRWHESGVGDMRQLALVRGHRLKCLLRRALDPDEFLSEFGVRSMSRYHAAHPFTLTVDGKVYSVAYEPAESQTGTFGGNSNWRGPVWFPLNCLLIEALGHFHHYYGDDFLVECPTGSGCNMTLNDVARYLARRLIGLFRRDADGCRPFNGTNEIQQHDPQWRDYLVFHEYFHGETGMGLGASHQTGWTGLVARLIQRYGGPD